MWTWEYKTNGTRHWYRALDHATLDVKKAANNAANFLIRCVENNNRHDVQVRLVKLNYANMAEIEKAQSVTKPR